MELKTFIKEEISKIIKEYVESEGVVHVLVDRSTDYIYGAYTDRKLLLKALNQGKKEGKKLGYLQLELNPSRWQATGPVIKAPGAGKVSGK